MTFTILTTVNNWNDPMVFWQDTLQVENCNLFEAIEEWATIMTNCDYLGKLKYETLLNKIKNLSEEEKNVWECSFKIKNNSIWVSIVKTNTELELYFDEDAALDFIFENLPQDFNGQYTQKDIELILNLEFEFLKEIGKAKSKYNRSIIIEYEFDDETEDKKLRYVHENALKYHKKHFQDDFIVDVLDLEFQYMEKTGLIFDTKLKLFGLEFNQPEKN